MAKLIDSTKIYNKGVLMRRAMFFAVFILMVIAGPACAKAGEKLEGAIQIKGSDTMVNLTQAWAEAFMAKYPQVNAAVTGGGSGTGFAALIGGTCDIAAASRKITDKEISQTTAKGNTPEEFKVALDGLAVAVHPQNPVKKLTVGQLSDLFTGKIKNWKEVGGEDKAVVLLSREVNSGTHVYFKEHVLGASQEFAPEALLMPSSQAIADEVASNPSAIGYYGMGYSNPKNAVVAVAKTAGDAFISPNEETVRSGTYPIARPLFLYTHGQPSGAVKAFLDFVMSKEGQAVVRKIDFVPINAQ